MVDTSEWNAHDYLQAVYQGRILAEPQRMKAAIECLPFERPKLSLSASTAHKGMGDMLDAVKAGKAAKQIEGRAIPAGAPMAPQAGAVAERDRLVEAGTPERPVVSPQTLRRVVERLVPGREAEVAPPLRSKPG
jgi:hypothetical protein